MAGVAACLAGIVLSASGGGARAGEHERRPIGNGAQFVLQRSCPVGGVARKAIFAHPPWKGAKGRVVGQFDIHLNDAKAPALVFSVGIRDGHGSDRGVIFRVSADGEELWSEWHKDSTWVSVRVDLARYAGKAMKLDLAVDSLGEHFACWGEPRIVDEGDGGRALYDLADMAAEAAKFIVVMDSVPEDQMPANIRRERERVARASVNLRPTPQQLAWQEMELIAFAHFGMNTFTDREWGDGREDPKLFNPTAFDARQWVRVLGEAGFRLLILTAKHHDGFCLWPSEHTEHSVKNSPWRGGKGDVVREVSDACRDADMKFGVYLSPWDRHEPTYGDSPAYNEYFKKQLTELLTRYGPVAEVWFDGACGEGPSGKRQVYDWASYYALVRKLQPGAVIAIMGPDVRWVGNETGVARETEWSVQPANPVCHEGIAAPVWYPAECDVSIRPGWFYHPHEDAKVKSLDHLLDIYYKSVGRNSVLLLNVPPDRRGLIHEADTNRLREFRRALDDTFDENLARGATATATSVRGEDRSCGADKTVDGDGSTYWSPERDVTNAAVELDLGRRATFNRSMVQEHIALGQRIEEYLFEAEVDGEWRPFARGTTVGHKKLDRFREVTAGRVRLTVTKSRASPAIREIGLFLAPPRE